MAGFVPVFFVLFWLLITSVLGLMTGWFSLQAQFPRNDDQPLLILRGRSGNMGWVNLNGILSLAACHSGLRVGIWRMFGPFQRPFQVPWDQIDAEPVNRFFEPMVRLRFGRPASGKLTIGMRSWERLKAAGTGMPAPPPTVTRARLARTLLFQWAAITGLAGSVFFLVSYLAGGTPIPIAACFGPPAMVFGIATGIRALFLLR